MFIMNQRENVYKIFVLNLIIRKELGMEEVQEGRVKFQKAQLLLIIKLIKMKLLSNIQNHIPIYHLIYK